MVSQDFEARTHLFGFHVNAPYVQYLKRLGMDIDVASAQGAVVLDTVGRRYIDCIAGYGNCLLGHNHLTIVDAVIEELRSARPYNLPFIQDIQVQLARTMAQMAPSGLECSFFVNSGSEAVETALKLARLATGKPGIICMRGAWHGFTAGCMSVSEPTMTKNFTPLLPHVTHVPYGDAEAVEAAMHESIGCVIVEPIQAENGALVPPLGYLKALEEICGKHNTLLIFDEVKTGLAKTGKLFACEYDGAIPDMLVVGKALGGGVMPIGGVVAKRRIWSKFGFSFPMSSSSGAGNAPACASALTTLRTIVDESLVDQVGIKGNLLCAGLTQMKQDFPNLIRDVSGAGLLLAIHAGSQKSATEIVAQCARKGVLIMNAFCDRTKVLIEPPAVILREEIAEVIGALRSAVAVCGSS